MTCRSSRNNNDFYEIASFTFDLVKHSVRAVLAVITLRFNLGFSIAFKMYGFNYATLTCNTMRIDQWMAVFGPDDEDETKQDRDEIQYSWSSVQASQQQIDVCSPSVCGVSSGFCVDCTNCSRHCTCGSEQLAPTVVSEPPECDPSQCRQLICGDCSRCTEHCVCHWEYPKGPPLWPIENTLVDAYLQSEKKKEVYYIQGR
jgi:hypothetical protein